MTEFSSTVSLAKTREEVYAFLSDLNNHQQLMPENVYNWSSTADEARFTIQNMAKLVLKVSERIPGEKIVLIPAEPAPIDLNLQWILGGENGTVTATLLISAELNMMMKVLASGPLQKLADHQTERLKSLLG
ncbi:MAG: SRPBCC family protein [Mucilaginibacter polytrichastri]|nr:SRPBCC family protein [Mucilaginibacter polytrichastri]